MQTPSGMRFKEKISAVPGIVLVGFMGAGKTSVGRALGRRLGWAFEDLDHRIETQQGRKVAEIFRDLGEAAFRQAERQCLKIALRELKSGNPKVIALGGGAFVQQANAEALKRSGIPVLFLDAAVEELWRRCHRQAQEMGNERPLLQSMASFRELYLVRRRHYEKATLQIDTAERSVDQIVNEIVSRLALDNLQKG